METRSQSRRRASLGAHSPRPTPIPDTICYLCRDTADGGDIIHCPSCTAVVHGACLAEQCASTHLGPLRHARFPSGWQQGSLTSLGERAWIDMAPQHCCWGHEIRPSLTWRVTTDAAHFTWPLSSAQWHQIASRLLILGLYVIFFLIMPPRHLILASAGVAAWTASLTPQAGEADIGTHRSRLGQLSLFLALGGALAEPAVPWSKLFASSGILIGLAIDRAAEPRSTWLALLAGLVIWTHDWPVWASVFFWIESVVHLYRHVMLVMSTVVTAVRLVQIARQPGATHYKVIDDQ